MKQLCCYVLASAFLSVYSQRYPLPIDTITILYTSHFLANSIIPSNSIGGAIDGHEKGDIDKMLNAENIKKMHSVGFGPVSYRLRTELEGEVWHWNTAGKWSDQANRSGYWISDSQYTKPINLSYGYSLPRRGNTIDHAKNTGYSRIDDGDSNTFWKSNPYLDPFFTNDPSSVHPQWMVVDLGRSMTVNAIRIKWGRPFAVSYRVDYATDIGSDYFEPFHPGLWNSFDMGDIKDKQGDDRIQIVSGKLIKARFIRITFIKNSSVDPKQAKDSRDSLGFAVKELEAGLFLNGKFTDYIHHAPDHIMQSKVYVSSTDSWHRAIDIDQNTEQVGIDRFFSNELTRGKFVLFPVALLYDTPENMIAMLHYLKNRNYSVIDFEMGEEPEGQLISAIDYASLYYRWGKELKKIIAGIHLGGPGFATLAFTKENINGYSEGKWTKNVLMYLKQHKSSDLFNFFSFEWYPFDELCFPTYPQLASAPYMLQTALEDIQKNVLPKGFPVYLTEYGYSAFSGKPEVEIEGALMYADILGKFLSMGGTKSFLYGWEPAYLEHENCGWGNNILFGLDDNGKIRFKTAAYYGMQMLTHSWLQPFNGPIQIFKAENRLLNSKNEGIISAYSLLRPDNKWGIVLINKDPSRTIVVKINISNADNSQTIPIHFPVKTLQYSRSQYRWVNKGEKGYPSPELPPVEKIILKESFIELPPYSLTVVNEQ